MRIHHQIGVIGLGSRWRRYQKALAGLHGQLEVRAVWDRVPARAARVAQSLRCAAPAGLIELVEREDVQGILLLERPWHGFWILPQAARRGKPVCSVVSLLHEGEHLPEVRTQLEGARAPVLMASAFEQHPLIHHLRRLSGEYFGEAQLLCCEMFRPVKKLSEQSIFSRKLFICLLGWLQTCRDFFGTTLEGASLQAPPGTGLLRLLLEFGGGRGALLTLVRRPGVPHRRRVELHASRGMVTAIWPRRLHWRDLSGHHHLKLPPSSASQMILWQFCEAMQTGQSLQPGFEDACQCLPWLEAIQQSHATGRRWSPGQKA